ncbi:hypothetical protein KEJ51_06825 [Candidatus Bathyarchaeota archaeon]|nr:hypothetical protein [Candidatus Bathyarchaeota archaeon]MBS7629509.1 hypothetical protein [Candidatus Bathyarchaeota archaeon]
MSILVGLTLIIIFVWATMLLGLVLIFLSIPYLTSTFAANFGKTVQNIIIVGVSAAMVVFWLWIWKTLAFKYFQWTLRKVDKPIRVGYVMKDSGDRPSGK